MITLPGHPGARNVREPVSIPEKVIKVLLRKVR